MKIWHLALIVIFTQSSYGRLNVPRKVDSEHDPNNPRTIYQLSQRLSYIIPRGLEHEKRMILEKLTRVRSQVITYEVKTPTKRCVRRMYAVWFYEFQALGMSSESLYDCNLVQKVISKGFGVTKQFNCKLHKP